MIVYAGYVYLVDCGALYASGVFDFALLFDGRRVVLRKSMTSSSRVFLICGGSAPFKMSMVLRPGGFTTVRSAVRHHGSRRQGFVERAGYVYLVYLAVPMSTATIARFLCDADLSKGLSAHVLLLLHALGC
jgi:hypothetical protein